MIKRISLHQAVAFIDKSITLVCETNEDKDEVVQILINDYDGIEVMKLLSVPGESNLIIMMNKSARVVSVEEFDKHGYAIPDGFLIESCLSNYGEGDELWVKAQSRKTAKATKSGSIANIKPPRI